MFGTNLSMMYLEISTSLRHNVSCYYFRCWNTFCREILEIREGISGIRSHYAISVLFFVVYEIPGYYY